MRKALAAMPHRGRWPAIVGTAALAVCLSHGAALAAGPYIDVEPEIGSQPAQPATTPAPRSAAASASSGGGNSQLIPSALPPWERSGSAATAAAAPAAHPNPPPQTHPQTTATAAAAPPAVSPPAPPPPPAHATAAAAAPPAAPAPSSSGSSAPAQSAVVASAAIPPANAAATAAAGDLGSSPLAVVRWSLNAGAVTQKPDGGLAVDTTAGQPLYLKFTIDGGQPAVDRLRQGGPIAIALHWTRDGDAAAPPGGAGGAPNLTTQLTVGRPELAGTFASQIARQGYFEWHLWARKDALTPGQWTVTLTYPDGSPVQCGKTQPQPCRLSINVS